MKNKSTSPDPRHELESAGLALRILYRNVLALRRLRAPHIMHFTQAFRNVGDQVPPDDVTEAIGKVFSVLNWPSSTALVTLNTLLAELEPSPDFIEAEKILAPIFARIAEYDAAEEAKEAERSKIITDHHNAREAARERALAAAEEDPAVVAARTALENFE